jgi:hypothetical protein
MSYERLPYADAETVDEMSSDCLRAGSNLPFQRATHTVPGDLFEDAVASHPTFASSVAVPDSLARLAGEMQLHFD